MKSETVAPNPQSSMSQSELLAHYERIIAISQQLNSTYDHRDLLQKIISAAKELTHSEAASIMLVDSFTGELRFEISSNIKAHEMEEIIIPMEHSIAGWIVTHGEPRVIEDASQNPDHFKGVGKKIGFQTRNLLGVPMRTHTKVIGVLQTLNKRNNEAFNADDINTLTTLASQAATAIENARLFQQSDFIAEMVHELRTPLAALKASTSLLLRPDLPGERREEIITTMQGETQRLIRLTSEFLDVARWESGRERIQAEPFDVHKLIIESAEVVLPQANEKGISVTIDEIPYTVNADRGKTKQVLLNLLTNAIKYNRENGQIFIGASVNTKNYDQPFIELAIADTGYGISKENQKHMFQKFYRVADTAGFTQGTGLGLALIKHIIEAHGGHIWLESEEGVGSTFFFTLPSAE
jgi:signal transduction histidine kinase